MYVFIVEGGMCSQSGKVLHVALSYEGAKNFLSTIIEGHEKAGYEVHAGISEYDTSPETVCGFWAGPKGGNTCAHGYRISKVWAI